MVGWTETVNTNLSKWFLDLLGLHFKWGSFANSASADGGPQPPIGTGGIFTAHVSAESPSNISPNHSEVISKVSELYNIFLIFVPPT